mgnify:CR=1 FL=1
MTKACYSNLPHSNPPYANVLAPGIGGVMQVPAGYWGSISNIRDNLEWLIEKEKLAFDDDLPRRMTKQLLEKLVI